MANPVTHEDLMDTIGARINTILVPLLPANTTVIYDNQEDVATPSDPWIRAAVVHGGNFQADVGAVQKRFRRKGRIVFTIFGKLHVGTESLNQFVAYIESVFRAQRVDGVCYQTPIVEAPPREGKYYVLTVTCPFWVDVF